jgi:predicted kinase
MKGLYLLRGLPGSGKSTLAKSLGGKYAEADQYFMEDGEYKFNTSKIKDAHAWCQDIVHSYLRNGVEKVIVSNTFTQEWEMESYYKLAEQYGYRVYSLIVENRHGGVNVHGVPGDKLEQMKNRFEIKI